MYRTVTLTLALALGLALAAPVSAQDIRESPSTVDAVHVDESASRALAPGKKISHLYTRNVTQEFIPQKLTDRVYLFQSQFNGTIFCVGDEGVLMFDALDWDFLSGGHGNVGSRADVDFYRQFLDDLEAAVGEALANVPWGAGTTDPAQLNAHTAYLSNWIAEVGKYATEKLRPVYGDYSGFDHATPKNAELVGMYFYSYR
ncbi:MULTISPECIES: hypothetical protein [Mameliella]|uniref:hypothetical protein n=1 Tax=Mameliella TaxID=1434019 RepID=UPI000B52F071|nr:MULTISPECIES: hypothetical protein [Mameliella]MCR9272118.1 hypothetical protein [Paracoccaceae bacterium]OWV62686.1 hypothetical protein CDZ98_00420 [Mameliella alba]